MDKPFVTKTHIIKKRIKELKAEAEPNWINMTEEIKNDFIEAVAKMHGKEMLSNSIDATT